MTMGTGLSRRSLLAALGASGAAAVGLTAVGGLTGCGPRQAPVAAAGNEEAKLSFYNWDSYIGPTTLADFKKETGIEVTMSLFPTGDELFAGLKAAKSDYDVIVPSNEFVTRMSQAGMLMPLDHAKIPNIKNIDPRFLNPEFDPGCKFSMPYTWSVLGIGYRKSKVKTVPDSWRYLFESDDYRGRIALPSSPSDLIRLAAIYRGHSPKMISPDHLADIEAMLIKQKPFIKAFHDDNGQDLLLAKDVDLAVDYNGDMALVMRDDPDIDFVVPKEGSLLSSDSLCIPLSAPHPNNAHAFINYLLDGQVGAAITKKILFPTPNLAAKAIMPESYRSNPVVFPRADIMARCTYSPSEGLETTQMFEQAMTRIRAA